jgi:hypothetical protein
MGGASVVAVGEKGNYCIWKSAIWATIIIRQGIYRQKLLIRQNNSIHSAKIIYETKYE